MIDPRSRSAVTVLGIGNPIMGDDGIGIVLLEELMAAGVERPVDFIDGGTIGMSLLPVLEDAGSLLVLDAVTGSGPPGTLVHLVGDQLPRLMQSKLSPHQVGLLDVLAAARLRGTEPDRIAVVGLTPGDIDLRVTLSHDVAAAIPRAVGLARQVLEAWWAEDDAGQTGRPAHMGGQACSGTSSST
jgi:hydrogenase maturation protease